MDTPRVRPLLTTLSLITAALSPAQERRATIGTVRNAAGEPVAGASVTLTGSLPRPHDPVAAPDVVTATTDDRGSYRVELVSGLDYSAWATGPARDGLRLATRIVERVRAGEVMRMRARRIPAPDRLRVDDFDRYADLTIRSVQIWLTTPPAAPVTLELDDEGTAKLPPLPDAQFEVIACDAAGEPRFGRGMRPEAAMTLHTLEPHPVPVLVRGPDGAPVEDAVVHQMVFSVSRHDRTLWRRVGDTDAKGRLSAHAVGADPYEHGGGYGTLFCASKPGTTESFSGWYAGLFWRDGAAVDAPDAGNDGSGREAVELVLHPAPTRTGRLLENGAPIAGRDVFVTVDCPLRPDQWSHVGVVRTHVVTSANDGSFALPQLPGAIDSLQLAVAPPAGNPASAPVLGAHEGLPGEEIAIDLATLPTVEIQVLLPDGGPATSAIAMLLPAQRNRPASSLRRLPSDRAGRIAVRVEAGLWLLFVHDDEAAHAMVLAVDRQTGGTPREIRLEPLASLRGTVRDGEGRPRRDAAIQVMSLQTDTSPPDDERLALLRHHGLFLNNELASGVRTDDRGAFRLPFLDLPGTTFTATTSYGGRFELVAGGEVEIVCR